MRRLRRALGVHLESLGDSWASYSPASGDTHLLNEESAAIVDVLPEQGEMRDVDLFARLAHEWGVDVDQVAPLASASLGTLIGAGLIIDCNGPIVPD